MFAALRASFALFIGLALIMVGNGLGMSLVGVRAQVEGFNNTITGLIMAGYFVGFFFGSMIVPRLMARVGHVRVFGALTALASLAILVFPMVVDPWLWVVLRVLIGLAFAGLYIVVESWLNDKATNDTRGQIMAIYLVISSLAVSAGNLMLNLYPPGDFRLFTVVSILASVAAIPVLISAARAPDFDAPETMGPLRLYKISPLGTFGMVLVGVTAGIFIGMGPAYAFKVSGTEFASYFMTAFFVGGFLFTLPLGKASDVFDRRKVIIFAAGLAVVISLMGVGFDNNRELNPDGSPVDLIYRNVDWFGQDGLLLLISLAFGGVALPLYSLCIAHTNDYLTPKQMVAASSTLVMANGFGAMIGPSIGGLAMDYLGPPGLFWCVAVVSGFLCLFGLYRMTRRPTAEDQSQFVVLDVGMTAVATTSFHPDVEWPEEDETADTTPQEEDELDGTWDDLPEPEPAGDDEPENDDAVAQEKTDKP